MTIYTADKNITERSHQNEIAFKFPPLCSDYKQSCTKYLEQSKEIQYNWTGLDFHIYFCVLLDCFCQKLISERKIGH